MMVAKRRITRTTFAILCTLILVLLLFFAWFNDSPSKLVTEEFFTTAPIPSFSAEPTALYLTYLPHSGFHNQRVSLENAFVLAALLNRTLIVPPARLSSKPIRYFPTRKLVSAIEISNDRTLEPCPTGQDFNDILGNDMCNPYGDFIHLSWRHLMPIDRLRNKIPFIERDDMRQGWFNASLNIPSDDVYWARDKSSYEFSFYDTPSGVSINPKYSRHIHLGDLSNQTQGYRLLHFGTLFGSGRLRLSDSSSFEHLKTVREAMALSNPLLNKLSDQVVKQIGGKDSYYAIHLRLRDGVFAENATANSQAILEAALLELFGTADESVYMNLTSVVPHLSHFDDREQTQMCSRHFNGRNRPFLPLYIATDVDPRRHPAFKPFFRTFPCIYFLSSFKDAAETLKEVRSAVGNGNLGPWLIPFLDALVVGNSAGMIGTPNSTFSGYISRILWPVLHGLPVVRDNYHVD